MSSRSEMQFGAAMDLAIRSKSYPLREREEFRRGRKMISDKKKERKTE